MARDTIFWENRSYRLRRAWDAVRLLPFLGGVLWFVPLIWTRAPEAAAGQVAMSSAILYIFVVWAGLIVLTAALWRRTKGQRPDGEG